jgi:signal transduction histidine kinase/ligand-binding sensor domain-containing protein
MSGLARLLVILFLLDGRPALALDPDRHITELNHRVWESRSGVPADIRALAQTTDGYLWIGSLRGLYRFDGVQFQKFEPGSGALLRSQRIRSLLATPDGRLWVGYLSSGVSVLEAGKLINYTSADGLPDGDVRSLARDQQGRIWVAASSGGLAYFEDGRWHKVGSELSFPGSRASAVLVDHLGAIWVAGEHRVAVLRSGAAQFELADEPYNGSVAQLAESPDGTVWMAETSRAVRPVERPRQDTRYKGLGKADCQNRFPDTWQTEPKCRRPDDLEVRVGSQAMLFDQNGGFWITTVGDGLRRAPHPSHLQKQPIGEFSTALEQFTSKDGLSADIIGAILEDREGNIWVATLNGLDQFRNSAMAPVALGPDAAVLSLAPADEGYIVAASINGHVFRFHDASDISVTNTDSGMALLYRDPFGSIWATGAAGGCRFVGNKCASRLELPGEESRLWDPQAWRVAVDGNRRLWAYVSHKGLFVFEDGSWTQFGGAPALSATATTQYTDPAGRIWFGFEDGRLLTIADGDAHLYSSEDGLTLGEVKAIASIGTHVWVGGEHGLLLLRGQRFTPVVPYDAPAFGAVSGIVEAHDGSLWLNEYRGVLRVPASELTAILHESSHPTHYEAFATLDGLPGGTELIKCPTAIRGTDGRLWFTTNNGAAWVDPRHLYRNELPPPVVIQSVVADGRTLSSFLSKLELPSRTTYLQISYAGLSLSVPERVQYRYRLKGLDATWQSAGTRRTADYTRLPPGSYDFQVTAANDSGVWNNFGAELAIRIIPAWYQTWWFSALSALLVVAALIALYRLRVAHVRADTRRLLEARLSERERIARDLHDTLLQGIQGLIWRFQSATNRIPPELPARQLMEQSLDRADKLLEESRDRVKDLRPIAAEVIDLTQALAAEGEQLGQVHAAKFRMSVQGTPRDLNPIVREEEFLIAREALSNAFRHSGAKNVEVEVTYGSAAVDLRVRDDGRGISASVLELGGRSGHFGLIGMRERARKLGGQLVIWSKPQVGTEVELRIPAHIAYGTSRATSSGARSLLKIFRSSTKAP